MPPRTCALRAQLLENSTRMRPHSRERLHDLQLSLRVSESAGAPLATSMERAAEHAEERIDALLGRQSALARTACHRQDPLLVRCSASGWGCSWEATPWVC